MEQLPLSAFGIEGAIVSPLEGSTINRVYRVDAASGTFVLKEYSGAALDAGSLQRVCDAQVLAHERGLPVPYQLPARNAAAFIEHEGTFFALSAYVPGRLYPPGTMPVRAARHMGEMLVRLLDALELLSEGAAPPLPPPEWIEAHLRSLLAIGNQRRQTNPLDETACRVLEQKLRILHDLDGPPEFTPQWTHGDYEWRNVLFDEDDEIVGIIDFDNLLFNSRARDVLRCSSLSYESGSPQVRAYLEGYVAGSGITPDEARSYVEFYRYISTFRTWPVRVRYLDPGNYQARWDEFLQPSTEMRWDWDALTDEFVEVARMAARA